MIIVQKNVMMIVITHLSRYKREYRFRKKNQQQTFFFTNFTKEKNKMRVVGCENGCIFPLTPPPLLLVVKLIFIRFTILFRKIFFLNLLKRAHINKRLVNREKVKCNLQKYILFIFRNHFSQLCLFFFCMKISKYQKYKLFFVVMMRNGFFLYLFSQLPFPKKKSFIIFFH